MNKEEITIRSIQHFMYCPHRWGLLEIDKAWAENFFVTRANLMHERVHDPDRAYTTKNKKVFTSVPVYHDGEEYNLYGVTDCLELTKDEEGVSFNGSDEKYHISIVEYKPTIPKSMDYREFEPRNIFGLGKENTAFAQYFTGQSYLNMLSTTQVGIGNVTFEPGCRNNWHVHHAAKGGGQILLVTAGRGYYQEWGKEAQELHPGDVVNIPVGVKHWHGAAPDSWFAHLAVEVPGEETSNEWLEPVSDEEYGKLK